MRSAIQAREVGPHIIEKKGYNADVLREEPQAAQVASPLQCICAYPAREYKIDIRSNAPRRHNE